MCTICFVPFVSREDRAMQTSHLATLYETLRSIVHVLDTHSRSLQKQIGVTATQLAVLQALAKASPLPISEVSKRIHLSGATISGTADRLVESALIERRQSDEDRRVMHLHLTDKGRRLLDGGPSPLPDRLVRNFNGSLPDWEKEMILAALHKLAFLMRTNGNGHGDRPAEQAGGAI